MKPTRPGRRFLHNRTWPPLVQIALAHYQFEAIHPFIDGNGRVGRLLITLFLVERNVLPTPLLYLSAFFEATRQDYYDGSRGVSERGAWEPWLVYFLNGVARQSEDALARATRINAMLESWRREVGGRGARVALRLVDLLGDNPYCSVKRVAEKLSVAFTTAQRAVDALVRANILRQVGEGRRDRAYCATTLLAILEEPARIAPVESP